jgi:hypothetical protein
VLKYLRKIMVKPATFSLGQSNKNLKPMLKYLRRMMLKPTTLRNSMRMGLRVMKSPWIKKTMVYLLSDQLHKLA